MDISNLDFPIKTNNKVAGKFKQEIESVVTDEFIVHQKHIDLNIIKLRERNKERE